MTAAGAAMSKAELMDLFDRMGFQPNARRGQNFLIDPNMCRAIVDSAELDERDVVLEIGPGAGALTGLLCERARAVVAVELDRRLFRIVETLSQAHPNLKPILGDAVARHHYLNTEADEALRALLDQSPDGRLKVVSNLPYSSATPAIVALLTCDLPVILMVLTVQKEIADRIAAAPRTKDYGLLSVTVQAAADVRTIRRLPPDLFWPRPKVSSAAIEVRPRADLMARIDDRPTFFQVARALFLHRRKTALNCLRAARELELGPDAANLLAACGVDPMERGEALTVEKIIELANTAFQWKSR